MDITSYNQRQGLEPLVNRFTKAAVDNPSEVMSLDKVTGVEGTEKDYTNRVVVGESMKCLKTGEQTKEI